MDYVYFDHIIKPGSFCGPHCPSLSMIAASHRYHTSPLNSTTNFLPPCLHPNKSLPLPIPHQLIPQTLIARTSSPSAHVTNINISILKPLPTHNSTRHIEQSIPSIPESLGPNCIPPIPQITRQENDKSHSWHPPTPTTPPPPRPPQTRIPLTHTDPFSPTIAIGVTKIACMPLSLLHVSPHLPPKRPHSLRIVSPRTSLPL